MSELIAEHIPETVTVEIVVTETFGLNVAKVRNDADVDFDQLGDIDDPDHMEVQGHLTKINQVVEDEIGEFDEEAIDVEGEEHVVASATVDRDTLEIVDGEDEDETEDGEPELVTDGGEEIAPDVTDEEIEEAIDQHDTRSSEESLTVTDIRDALAAINADIIDNWVLYEDAIDENAHEIVCEDDQNIVLADHSGHFWSEQLAATDGVDSDDDVIRSILISLHHTAARDLCDYSWGACNPAVIAKPRMFEAAEEHMMREIARRTNDTGSVARAVDQLATEAEGYTKSGWASRTGRNPSTVTRMTQPKE